MTHPPLKRRAPREQRRGIHRSRISTVFIYVAVLLLAIWVLLPLVFTLASSFQPSVYSTGGLFSNFTGVFRGHTAANTGSTDAGTALLPAIGQSFLVSTLLVICNLIIGGLAGYGLSHYPFRGGRSLYLGVIATRVVPAIAIVGPFFVVFRHLQILDTPWALLISYNVFTLPLTIMVLKNYFDQLPRGIEEAAIMDGASRMRTLLVIVVPLARPGLAAAGVLIFLEAWSEFFYSLVLTNQLTVPPLLAGFQSAEQFDWGGLAAATVISIVPPAILAMIFQRNIVGALVAGYEK